MPTQATGEIVKEYLARFPAAPSHRLAATIMEKVPGLFVDHESARSAIRYYRGATGKKLRNDLAEESYFPRITITKGEEENFDPYILPDDSYPLIAAGDVHAPYHDRDAVEIFIERAVKIKARTVLLAGDWLDMYQVSRWEKDPRNRSVKEEFEIMRDILRVIRKALPKAMIIYKKGNHEERWDLYLMRNAPALWGLESMRMENAPELGLKELGVEVVSDKRVIRAGHLNIIHGHEYVFSISNPVNPARGLYNRAKKSALCFHHHQTSEHTEPAINGDITTTWSAGCLCGLHPPYMPLNKWNHGFAEIDNSDGLFMVRNRRIINYRVV